ncbi:MAG: paraquat-inducible protein A [Pseudomonadota bacterium]
MAGSHQAVTAREAGLAACHVCGKLQPFAPARHCERCGSSLYQRKPFSVQRSWAFLITALILYLPANLYPIMTTATLGIKDENTIIGGVILLWGMKSYPVAVIVFIASIVIPLLKFLVISLLLLSIWRDKQGKLGKLGQQTRLFRFIEYIGPWSMIDVFVVILLVALIRFGGIASVLPGPAAMAFAGMVIATMLAALSFDTRLLWDNE